jgi:hypothetical protein
MKKFYFRTKTLVLALLLSHSPAFSQTTLAAGDIAFSGYHGTLNSPQSDAFSFVLLKNVAATTVIHFTDQGWGNDNVFRPNEQTLSLTFTTAAVAGREIVISGPPNGTPSASYAIAGNPVPTLSVTGSMLSLSVNGDQVIAYQSTTANVAPFTFISAMHTNVYNFGDPTGLVTNTASWENTSSTLQTANSSLIPSGLTNGTNAVWVYDVVAGINTERNNARFNSATALAGGAILSTVAGVRAALNNRLFWDKEFGMSGATPSWALPTGYNYLNVTLPLKFESFTGILDNERQGVLKWKVSNQSNINKYVIERSFDGIDFSQIYEITAVTIPSHTYNYTDTRLRNGENYYRIAIVENDGAKMYSNIVKLTNINNVTMLSISPNPVVNTLIVQQFEMNNFRRSAVIVNSNGAIINNIILKQQIEYINVAKLTSGLYYLKLDNGTALKFIKN